MNDELLKGILENSSGTIIGINSLIKLFKTDYNDLITELSSYEVFYRKNITGYLEKLYKKYSRMIIDGISQQYFQMPIDVVIATQSQEKIKKTFAGAAERMGFNEEMQIQIYCDLEDIANSINKRFTFDEVSLIHLIEATKGKNIQEDEDFKRFGNNNKPQILSQNESGSYDFVSTEDSEGRVYTSGGVILPRESSNIGLSSYPGGKDLIGSYSKPEVMQKVMQNLFDNLELCMETYRFYYAESSKSDFGKGKAITNVAVLADDSTFDFKYTINSWNLPHLLGIQRGATLSQGTLRYFNNEIDENSNAYQVLNALLKNKSRIIADGGLIEENGKLYQLLPWEKIILKTSSFIRGDFFKTCFCLAELQKGIFSKNEKYVAISETDYKSDIIHDKFDANKVLEDLMKIGSNSKDFVFRTFVEHLEKGELTYIPDSISTGKAENIVTTNNIVVETLNKYRNAIGSSGTTKDRNESMNKSGGGDDGPNPGKSSIVKSVKNDIIGEKSFSKEEQAVTHLAIVKSLNMNPQLSREAMEFELKMKDLIERELELDLERLLEREELEQEMEMQR